jgi:SAM-dependent methyltransferase
MAGGYVWAVRRHVPAGSTVLELGCGSGIRYLSRRYRTIGLDLSAASLARVADLYATCLQVDLTRGIPLPDASVNAAISSFVWEHIVPEDKPAVLAELRRVLRPGGKLIFLYDVDGRHPLYRRMQAADPALFQEVLIDREGHSGWQNAEDNAAAFEASGLRVLEHRGMEKLLIGPAMYDKVAQWPGALRRWARVGLRFQFGWRFQIYNAAMRILDESVGRWLPASWARMMVTVCERR